MSLNIGAVTRSLGAAGRAAEGLIFFAIPPVSGLDRADSKLYILASLTARG